VLPVAAVLWGGGVTALLATLVVLPLLVLAWGGADPADNSMVNMNAPEPEWRQQS
jgi:hypothetical protein